MSSLRQQNSLIHEPRWVLAKYEEAKALIDDIRSDVAAKRAAVEDDLIERIEDFWTATFMDRCTTMGIDCGCNLSADEKALGDAQSRMRNWAAEHPEADTQGLMPDEWVALARAALGLAEESR